MQRYKIALPSYLNSLPFSFGLSALYPSIIFEHATPTALNDAVKKGHVEHGLTSSALLLEKRSPYLPFCIAANREILSVNLYSKVPLQKLSGKTVALSSESATSSALVKLLCYHVWKVIPHFVCLEKPYENYDAFLLIGDSALIQQTIEGFYVFDLATQWYKATKLPFVFALFFSRDLKLTPLLYASLDYSKKHDDLLFKEAALKSSLSLKTLARYYSLCTYTLGIQEKKGLQTFRKLYDDLPKVFTTDDPSPLFHDSTSV